MKKGDIVRLKSKVICQEIDENCDRGGRLGTNEEMIFGQDVTVRCVFDDSFLIEESTGYYSPKWVDEVIETVTFKLDDEYSEATKMYLKATGLAINVMERIRVENPKFWEFLRVKGGGANFFKEILRDDITKSWEKENFNFKTANIPHFFEWLSSLKGFDYWSKQGEDYKLFVSKTPELKLIKASNYHFIDGNIDFHQLCSDTIKDGKTTFMVESKDKLYVGWKEGEGFTTVNMGRDLPVFQTLPEHSLFIVEVPTYHKDAWIKEIQTYATKYVERMNARDSYIKDRKRDKGDNRFTVTSY